VQAAVEVPNPVPLVGMRLVGSPPPEGGLAGVRSAGGRRTWPVRAASLSRPAPGTGLSHARRTMRDTTPPSLRWAFPGPVLLHLPVEVAMALLRFRQSPVAGLPRPGLMSRLPACDASPSQEPLGPPQFCGVSLPAGRGLRTPAALRILANADALGSPSVSGKAPASATSLFRSCTSTSGCAVIPTAYRMRCRRFARLVRRGIRHDSAMAARLDTGGWLALTRQGLSPCKRRQAFVARQRPS
jgi:hypothetical protein